MELSEARNKIILGDCIEVMKQLPDECVDLTVTSPPYNLEIEYSSYEDNLPYNEYLLWCKDWIKECSRLTKHGGRIAINIPLVTYLGGKHFIVKDYMNIFDELGLLENAFIIWDKQNITNRAAWGSWCSPSNPNIIQPLECIIVYSKGDRKKEGDKSLIDITPSEFVESSVGIWKIQPEMDRSHPAPFPTMLPTKVIKMFTYKHDLVLDMFSGSGTTAISAYNNQRDFICIEKDEGYYEKSLQRLKTVKMRKRLF